MSNACVKTCKDQIGRMLILFLLLFVHSVLYAQFAGGSGTEDDPWQIATPEHLNNVRNVQSGHFIQTADIDLGVAPYNEGSGWVPINSFEGSFKGNGFKIYNLMISRPDLSVGLFAILRNANIVNIALIDVNISGRANVGAISGRQRNGTISNSYVTGRIEGNKDVGGLIGNQDLGDESQIINCYSTAQVFGLGFISEPMVIGGLVGFGAGQMINCYALGNVFSYVRPTSSGGLIGRGNSVITNSFWNIESTGQKYSSGAGVGLTASEMTIQNSFVDWDFEETWAIGFNGTATYPYLRMQDEPLEEHYPLVPPTITTYTDGGSRAVVCWIPPSIGEPDRYLVYRNDEFIDSYAFDEREHLDTNLTDFTTYYYYLKAEYGDRTSTRSNHLHVTPVAEGYSMGRGTAEDPYQISTPEQLLNVGYNSHNHFIQTEDIDLSHIENWRPIGWGQQYNFTGVFDGNGFVISNLTINHPNAQFVGLFGFVGEYVTLSEGAVLRNIVLDNVNVTGSDRLAGLVCSIVHGIIDNCHVTGTVEGNESSLPTNIGSIAGLTRFTEISNCSAIGEVIAAGNVVGGLVGRKNGGIIKNCFSGSSVTGRGSYIGGLVGFNSGEIIHSYSFGSVSEPGGGLIGSNSGTVTNSYWNLETSGRDESSGGFGRRTVQMTYPYDEDTYLGWDFEDIWGHDIDVTINDGYPFLRSRYTYPYPDIAVNPEPEDKAIDVPIDLDKLSWSYESHDSYTNPIGFRVYLNNTGYFEEDDEYTWIVYFQDQEKYYCSDILPERLESLTTYYWKVVPTTNEPGRRGSAQAQGQAVVQNRERPSRPLYKHRNRLLYRGDAQDVSVWSFTTEDPTYIVANDSVPYITELKGNYPNPFNPETTISFSLTEAGVVEIIVFNIRGQKVATLLNSSLEAGRHQIIWNGRDDKNREVGSGLYFYRMKSDDFSDGRKMILIK